MHKFSSLFGLACALLLGALLSPVMAQFNPPPPPEEQNTGESPGMDQAAPPPPDQGQPAPDDQPAPPPGADMQGQPSSDQDAPDDSNAAPDASGEVNFQTFYNDLSSQGNWVQTDNYGYVWQPAVDDSDWRPYSNGHWVYTDEGWTWVADDSEPWGWATYHYGRWVNLDGYGWVWVPGYTWAPAWVSWRYGGGYCGWAPLPPDTFIGIDFGGVGFGFHIGGDCDTAYDIGPGYYNFIPVDYIGERDYRHHYADRNNSFAIIGNTRNVTNIVVNNQRGAGRFSRVRVGGPNLTTVDALASTPVQRVSLERTNRAGSASLRGDRLAVFAPRVQAASGTTFRPSRVSATVANARVNPGASLNDPLQVTAHVRGTPPSSAEIAAAQNARFSSNARVATAGTHPIEALTQPLNTYQPHEVRHAAATGESTSVLRSNAAETHAAASPRVQEDALTGESGAEVHHAASSGFNHTANGENTVTHHTVQEPSVATPQVQHSYVAPTPQVEEHPNYHAEVQEHHEDFHPPSQQVQHQEVQAQPQVQHQHQEVHAEESHPQAEHHDAAPQSASASAAPSSGGGGGKDDRKH